MPRWSFEVIRLFFVVLVLITVNCESSRDKCYEDLTPDYKSFCESIVIGYGAAENNLEREKIQNLSLVTCLLGSFQNKKCKKERNWDIVDIF